MTAVTPGRKTDWIVVADEAMAIIYSQDDKRSPLTAFMTLDNDAAQKKNDDILADKGGRSFDSFGQGRHTMSREKSDPKKVAAAAFAKDIATRIYKAKHNGTCREYAVIAAPRFLGLLREALARAGAPDPFLTIDKEVVAKDAAFIERLISSG